MHPWLWRDRRVACLLHFHSTKPTMTTENGVHSRNSDGHSQNRFPICIEKHILCSIPHTSAFEPDGNLMTRKIKKYFNSLLCAFFFFQNERVLNERVLKWPLGDSTIPELWSGVFAHHNYSILPHQILQYCCLPSSVRFSMNIIYYMKGSGESTWHPEKLSDLRKSVTNVNRVRAWEQFMRSLVPCIILFK